MLVSLTADRSLRSSKYGGSWNVSWKSVSAVRSGTLSGAAHADEVRGGLGARAGRDGRDGERDRGTGGGCQKDRADVETVEEDAPRRRAHEAGPRGQRLGDPERLALRVRGARLRDQARQRWA